MGVGGSGGEGRSSSSARSLICRASFTKAASSGKSRITWCVAANKSAGQPFRSSRVSTVARERCTALSLVLRFDPSPTALSMLPSKHLIEATADQVSDCQMPLEWSRACILVGVNPLDILPAQANYRQHRIHQVASEPAQLRRSHESKADQARRVTQEVQKRLLCLGWS